jgi:predicted amidohydrolase YtcJ
MLIIPLLKDNHNHLFTYAALDSAIDLFDVKSKSNALKKLQEQSNNDLVIAKGWFDSYYNFSLHDIEALPPCIIINNSLHKYVFNTTASQIINKDFSEWVKNNDNQIWVEKNLMQILSYIAGLRVFTKNSLNKNLSELLKKGVYFASDMFITNIEIFDFVYESELNNRTEIWTDPNLYPQLSKDHQSITKGVKIFTDGALGACTAAIKNYNIKSNPFLSYQNDQLKTELERLLSYKTAIAIHCIGDIAIEQVISTLDALKNKISNNLIRLEHAQFITKNQAFRAKDLGLTLSMQPNFNLDSVIYSDRLDKQYCKVNNPFRMLIDESSFIPGKDLILGSDGMPSGIEGCIQQSIFPPAPGQQLSLDEFVSGYCIESTQPGYIEIEIDQLKKKIWSKVKTP